MANSYADIHAICESTIADFIDSDEFFGFLTSGILERYRQINDLKNNSIHKLLFETGIDLRKKCQQLNVYYSRSASKVLQNTHPQKIKCVGKVLSLMDRYNLSEIAALTETKRTVINSNLNFIFGNTNNRKRFIELGWSIEDLPFMPSSLYKPTVKFIISRNLKTIKQLQFGIRRSMENGSNWWESQSNVVVKESPGFIYLAVIKKNKGKSLVKIGMTIRSPDQRLAEHRRSGKMHNDTHIIFKATLDPRSEEKLFQRLAKEYCVAPQPSPEEFWLNETGLCRLKSFFVDERIYK